jgi:hypothetical protein
MARREIALVAAALLIASTCASAREEWLAADQLHLDAAGKLTLHLESGDQFLPQEERTFVAKDNERFELYHGSALLNLIEGTHDGERPFWSQPLDFEGQYLVVLTRAVQDSEHVREWHFAKLLGRVGADDEGTLHHRFMGQQLELALIQNPALLTAGDEEIVQLYFETKPLAGQTVIARHRGGGQLIELSAVTDARGVARLRLGASGVWLLSTAYVRACKGCKDAQSESFRATYTFELGS